MPVAHYFDQKLAPEAVSARVGFVSSRFYSEMVSNLSGTVKLNNAPTVTLLLTRLSSTPKPPIYMKFIV